MGGRRHRWTLFGAAALVLAACTGTAGADVREGDPPSSSPTPSTALPAPDSTTTTDAPASSSAAPTTAAPAAGGPEGRDTIVTSITDGDTLRVTGGERVRLIGIDTPEVSRGVECFGREATAAITRLVPPGTPVRLVDDVEATDRYGRTLSYVYRRADGRFVNLAMAEDGFASVLTVPPNVAHAEDFRDAVAEARTAGRGLWSACDDTEPPAPPQSTSPTGACDPSYPSTCIPPAPPDLNCGDIGARGFTVRDPDPHGFDGDGNGVGCEV